MPRLVANRLAVPAGRIAIVTGLPASASIARCTVPSPPHTKSRSAPCVEQLLDALGHVLALRDLVPGRVADAVRGQRLAELGQPAAELLGGVRDHPDGRHRAHLDVGRLRSGPRSGGLGPGWGRSRSARRLDSATATPVRVARSANARHPAAPITLAITSVG